MSDGHYTVWEWRQRIVLSQRAFPLKNKKKYADVVEKFEDFFRVMKMLSWSELASKVEIRWKANQQINTLSHCTV